MIWCFVFSLIFPVGAELPYDHDYIIKYTNLIQDFQPCDDHNGRVPVCVSPNFMCRLAPGEYRSCFVVVENAGGVLRTEMDAIEPWKPCDPDDDDRNFPICQRQMQCRCAHGYDELCMCVPPDIASDWIVPIGHTTWCGLSNGPQTTCQPHEYCQWQENGTQKCARKPFYH